MLYKALLFSHNFIVTLFLVHYIVKLVLLLMNKKEPLGKYTKVTKVPEMIVSVGFLVTGFWMILNAWGPTEGKILTSFLIIKLVCVFASIPLAIIGFKKGNKVLAFVAVLLLVASYGLAEMNRKSKAGPKLNTESIKTALEKGQFIYENKNCKMCHGVDGKNGAMGAKDLSVTQLSAEDQKTLLKTGKDPMPAYKDLSEEELDALVQYIATLKQ